MQVESIHRLSKLEYGKIKSISLGKTKQNDKDYLKYANMDYCYEVRGLLESADFVNVEDLAISYFNLKKDCHEHALTYLHIGLFHSLNKKDTNGEFIFKEDAIFKDLMNNGVDNCNKTKEFEGYMILNFAGIINN